MTNYYFTMVRTYETIIEVKAENPTEALDKFEALGDEIYNIELEQTCIIDESLKFREGWEGTDTEITIEQPIYRLVKK